MQRHRISFAGGRYELPEYPFRTPRELSGNAQQHCVAIVGAGLVGLTAACALADLGVPVVVLDEDNSVGARGVSSRGVSYAQKSLEIFARLGIYSRVLEKGVTWSVGRIYAGDEQLYEFVANVGHPCTSVQPAFVNLQQFYVETFLIERAAQLPHVDLRWQSRVQACEQDASGVRLQVETPEGSYSLKADWVIDCSGAHSKLRTGVAAHSARPDDRWLICDVFIRNPPPRERRTWIAASFNEGRAAWQHVMADGVCRVDYQLDPEGDVADAASEAAIRERLRRQFGDDVEFKIVWVGAWTYRSECLASFRNGRLLFAGDAAHVMSPFGGRGGNSGIQDADNLAWKLALVVNGKADAALLDTYCAERRPAAHENIRVTDRTTRFLRPPSRAEHCFRDAVLALARKHTFARLLVNAGRMSLPGVYATSRLNLGERGGRSIPNIAMNLADGRPGDLAQLLRWANGNYLAVVRHPGLHLRALEQRYPVRFVAAEKLGAGFAGLIAASEATDAEVIFLRPDSYCAGCLDTSEATALETALRTLTCQ